MLYKVLFVDESAELLEADDIKKARAAAKKLYELPVRNIVAQPDPGDVDEDAEDVDEDDADEGEDKVERQSKKDRIHPMQLVENYTRSYFEDMDSLNVLRPDISPRATGHIMEQIEVIKKLIERGYAYEVKGSVYFDVSRDAQYGKLSGRNTEETEAGTRVSVNPEKKHPNDFALWKKAEPGHIMQWPSPWGVGYPGWHIECSAMSMKYLGESFDIHGGGMDNQFPHHECEIAQSECATGKPFVKYWIHNNLVTVNGKKMGKSLGNVILVKDALKKYHPLVIRFFILQSHYRSTLDFSDEALQGAARGLEKLHNTVKNTRDELARIKAKIGASPEGAGGTGSWIDVAGFRAKCLESMDDDFNTPQTIAVLFDFAHETNNLIATGGVSEKQLREIDDLFSQIGGIMLGIIPSALEGPAAGAKSIEDGLLQLIVDLRGEARTQKLFSFSDKIRDGLAKLGIQLEDKKE
jgi:cysteinyl-tRNA synthetase